MAKTIQFLGIILLFSLIISIIQIQIDRFKNYECLNLTKEYAFRSILQYWSQFAEEHKITYSISDGTLLGWLREKGEFIGFDGDMDAMIDYDGVTKITKLAGDSTEHRVIFTKDLTNELALTQGKWKPNEIKILVKYNNIYVDCNGIPVIKYTDHCSLGMSKWGGGELYGRVIFNNYKNQKYHLDLFAKKKYIHYFDEGTTDCILEGTKTKRFNNSTNYIKNRYGESWNIPWKLCDANTGKWYKNKLSPHYNNDPDAK